VVGSLFIFTVGVVIFATLALLPTLMQGLLSYPVIYTGIVSAPRGVATFSALFVVGWLRFMDVRYVIAIGFGITAFSLWMMTGFYTQMDSSIIILSGIAQGLGSGMVYVPLSSVAFATLPRALRNEGTALFSLARNLGSSIGISGIETLLTRNTQVMHSRLAEHVTAYGNPMHVQSAADLTSAHGLALANASVSGQAAMIAYNNDFKLMMILTLCVTPLIALVRKPPSFAAAAEPAPVVE
jgi:DHA2 family multidrug resistance protein